MALLEYTNLSLSVAATTDPVTLAEQKAHMRVTSSDEDDLIEALITAATEYCELFTGRQFVTATWAMTLPEFADDIILPRAPASSVTSIYYYDDSGTNTLLSASTYSLVGTNPGLITLAPDETWPSTQIRKDAVTVTWVAGYGAASAVPEAIKAAIRMLAAHLYEHREAVTTLTPHEMPMACKSLLWSYRIVEA